MRICIVGDPEDLSAAYLGWLAESRGVTADALAEERLGLEWHFELTSERSGAVTVHGRRIPLDEIDGAFVRMNPNAAVADELGVPPEGDSAVTVERRHGLHWLLDRLPGVVVNRPQGGRTNGSKPLQMRRLERHGFAVPAWLVTNDPNQASAFARGCPDGAIYKACSGLRSHVRRVDATLRATLGASGAPVLVQRYIPGVDVRVHVVGRACFGTEVRSAAIDYRFDDHAVIYEPATVPPEVVERCALAAAADGLELAGLDFRRAPDGAWWCLEMNPVPTFLPYEAATGQAIGDAILAHMLGVKPSLTRTSPLHGLTAIANS